MNAAHANINALRNASPNSQVGRIAAYKLALEGQEQLDADVIAALEALTSLQNLTPEELAALYPNDGTLIDQESYDAAVGAVAAGAATYDELANLTDEEKLASFSMPDPDNPEGPEILDQAAYDDALASFAGDKAEYNALIALTDEQKADQFPAAYDAAAYQGDLTDAGDKVAALEEEQSTAGDTVEAALLDASGGRTLSPEARAYLDSLLAGKTLTPDAATTDLGQDEVLLIPAEGTTLTD